MPNKYTITPTAIPICWIMDGILSIVQMVQIHHVIKTDFGILDKKECTSFLLFSEEYPHTGQEFPFKSIPH